MPLVGQLDHPRKGLRSVLRGFQRRGLFNPVLSYQGQPLSNFLRPRLR
jgi:hypothetical protein